jgi:MoaA/NifB/PqqE/SkfB family radical SAM enzyme
MEDKINTFLPYYSAMHFGAVRLLEEQEAFYQQFNTENISLCNALPQSVQKEALLFLKKYSGIKDGEPSDYFKNYYTPSWSIIYWLVQFDSHNSNNLTKEDIHHAVSAHSMAMNLHSLDDHLNDGQIPANHLSLLIRSQSWMRMNTALNRLATGVDKGDKIIQGFLNDYYSAISKMQAIESLDNYCERFRKQMATWLIVPILISKKINLGKNLTDAVQKAYESFGIAWRLLDDLQDIEEDMIRGEHSALYIGLPDKIKKLWDNIPLEKSSSKTEYIQQISDHIMDNGVVDLIRNKVVSELESATSIADKAKLTGLANEFHCLVKPLKNRQNHLVEDSNKEKRIPNLSGKTLSIEVTTECNSACSHCFVHAGMEKPSNLPLNVVKDIISEGHDLGYGNLHLTGGEPLLWDGLFKAIDSAVDLGYRSIFLNTNGTLLTQKLAKQLASYKNLKMSISLEGREPLHDRVRGKGSYQQTVKGIENALDAGINLCIFTTVRKSLFSYLSHFVFEVYESFPGISHLTFIQLIRVKGDAFDLSEELLTPDDFIKLVQAASLLNVYGHKTLVLNNPLITVTSKKLGIWGIPESKPLNRAGDFIVLANKRIASAHSTHNHFSTYEPGMLKNVLFSNEYLSAVTPDNTTCPDCKYSRFCKDNDMMRPSQWYRDMHPEVPFCKRVLARVPFYV